MLSGAKSKYSYVQRNGILFIWESHTSKFPMSEIIQQLVGVLFLFQANTSDELPERLISAIRVSHIELSSAIVPELEPDPSS